MRVLIIGSRDWTDTRAIREALTAVWRPDAVLVSGGARGADTLCESCWTRWGGHIERHPRAADLHGRLTGRLPDARLPFDAPGWETFG